MNSKTVILQARTDYRGIIKGTLSFINQTELHFTEVVDLKIATDKVKYRYHYQQMDSHLRIFRYDNAKHFPQLTSFPHHKHIGPETEPDKVREASGMSLEEVLREIEEYVIAHI
ncbi:MAG: hypothetical protein GY801_00080 [bacterium]|nr:hypothetical protein [bacterium]